MSTLGPLHRDKAQTVEHMPVRSGRNEVLPAIAVLRNFNQQHRGTRGAIARYAVSFIELRIVHDNTLPILVTAYTHPSRLEVF